MTPVYSGGLIYEYSWEGVIIESSRAGYGIIDIKGNSTKERPDFTALQSAFKKTPIPSGDGGYNPDNKASTCPGEGLYWKANTSLPTIPKGAVKFMSQGAAPGPGFNFDPDGSQWKGTPSTGSWIPIQAGNDKSTVSSTPSKPAKSVALAVPLPSFSLILLVMALIYYI
jgi:1,3-beta-glucanosyltransferase GAS5